MPYLEGLLPVLVVVRGAVACTVAGTPVPAAAIATGPLRGIVPVRAPAPATVVAAVVRSEPGSGLGPGPGIEVEINLMVVASELFA